MNITSRQYQLLACFTPDTYGMWMLPHEARELERLGLVEWVPPKFGTTMYAITEAGRKAVLEWGSKHGKSEETTN